MSSAERDRIQVLQKTMDILTVLVEGPASVRDLAERTGVTKPAVYRILHTLEERSFVTRDENRREYMLGEFLTGLSRKHDQSANLPRLVSPYMDALLKKFDETVNLGVLDGNKIKYLHSLESSQRLRSSNPREEKDNVHSTALGKAILSTFSEAELEKTLKKLDLKSQTDKTITTEKDLLSAISRAKKIGFAIDDQENELGSRCIAVAVTDKNGKALCALSITGPASRMSTEKIRIIGENLKLVAKQLSNKLQ
jgi:IclR family acetate operon transcriptional repressor